ncbi:hypothetical protein EDI_135500 [Entamoeba dispar SAW760]|uniref:UDENN domain-containing protein n=1 Tax=Entamoeba dispar (strain ATCC PRA-260 / SAW760) TaxID=370354 RepID=B0EEI2_ENTDS|nr:uncharacterized protein EDI_135500 [Entamoeba dispar SAW760]EDR27096.1 hypothetical protein EDI_135500 [Entamoeba dispar SAW760]|eukprot:EDR27096.1 hypothetical protein EDI_135500 [Entamoeba dispar SAW760]
MQQEWNHHLFEGCVFLQPPTELQEKSNPIQPKFSFPSSFKAPPNIHLFLYPELPETNFLPSYFIVTFTTPSGTQYGHTLRTENGSICLISFYCWEIFFRRIVIRSQTYWKNNFEGLEKYLNDILESPERPLSIEKTLDMDVPIVVEKLLLSQVMLLFNSIICERRIIVVGSNYETVTCFILSALELIEPLSWPHPIVTLLPRCYSELVDLPTPFICGISTYQFSLMQPLTNKVVVVDLDNGTTRSNDPLMIQQDKNLFPEFATQYLRESLKTVLMEVPKQIPIMLKQTFNQYILKLLQAPETFISLKHKRGTLVAEMDIKKYKKTYNYKAGSRKFIDFFSTTGAFDQYLQKIENEMLKGGGQIVDPPEPNFWDSLFQFNFPTDDLTKQRGKQYKMQ